MNEDMAVSDLIPRMEQWLQAWGIPPEDILKCTQFVHTGDPIYLIENEEKEKGQATKEP